MYLAQLAMQRRDSLVGDLLRDVKQIFQRG